MARSAGVLVYRLVGGIIEFLLLKPGGPFYKDLEKGIWTIPKGEIKKGETEIAAAQREFVEETGLTINDFNLDYFGVFKLRKGKNLVVYFLRSDFDLANLESKHFEMEHPKNSGEFRQFQEIEMGDWVTFEKAQALIFPNQLQILEQAIERLDLDK